MIREVYSKAAHALNRAGRRKLGDCPARLHAVRQMRRSCRRVPPRDAFIGETTSTHCRQDQPPTQKVPWLPNSSRGILQLNTCRTLSLTPQIGLQASLRVVLQKPIRPIQEALAVLSGFLYAQVIITIPAKIIGSDSHCPMVMPKARKPRKSSGCRANSATERSTP